MSEYLSFYGGDDLDHYYLGLSNSSSANHTLPLDRDGESAAFYYQGVIGFGLVMCIYFCMLCSIMTRDGPITKEEVERSIVHKCVLPHGQAHCFDCKSKKTEGRVPNWCRSFRSLAHFFFRRKRGRTISPAATDSNRCDPETSQSKDCDCAVDVDADSLDEVDQAEQGGVIELDHSCPICLERLKIGEEVAWSKLRHCQHTFHYDCIMKWLRIGHMHCPVCRDKYWKRNYRKFNKWKMCANLLYKKEPDKVDVMDARSFLFCEVHGLVKPTDSTVVDVETTSPCASRGSVLDV